MTADSTRDSIHVDWLDAVLRDGLPGRLGMTVLPGKHGASARYPGRIYRQDLGADLLALRREGVIRLMLLVDDVELARWGDPDLVAVAAGVGIDVRRHPMPDGGTPASNGEMDRILGDIASARARGNVAVACMGGVGRTGMVVACSLVEHGMAPERAIELVREVRHPEAVETAAQQQFVVSYAEATSASRHSPA